MLLEFLSNLDDDLHKVASEEMQTTAAFFFSSEVL